jgi:hypothetical protein
MNAERTAICHCQVEPVKRGRRERYYYLWKIIVCHDPQVRPNREAGSHQESQSIKHAGKVSGLLCEIPFEIQYTTDYTGQTIDIEQRRVGCCDKVSRQLSNGRDGRVVTPEQRRIVVNFLISVHVSCSSILVGIHTYAYIHTSMCIGISVSFCAVHTYVPVY